MERKETGVLCHISSLPGKYGIGSLGKEAYKFAKLLKKSGVKYWQVLPLVQTGYGDSPYSSVACTSGNPYFIDLDMLAAEGLLTKQELAAAQHSGAIDYGALYNERYVTLRKAFSRFFFDSEEFRAFVRSGVCEDYALFMTAKKVYGENFLVWEEPLKFRDPDALEKLRTDFHEEYLFWNFLQYEFRRQWKALKAYCNGLGIRIIGDIPLYVAADSADVWAHPELFKLDQDLRPTKVAGVPPDYFSETGQLWGNPIYDWSAHEKENFTWWTGRLNDALETYDIVRIDHFRGIDRYYEIPAFAENAVKGEWKEGPGKKLFACIRDKDRFIAEDLGIIDEGVVSLRYGLGFPGMKVLLFAFDGDPENEFLPSNITENSVCYTGTHDNDTVAGYVKTLSAEELLLFRSRVAQTLQEQRKYIRLGKKPEDVAQALCKLALSVRSKLTVLPVQDILGLDNNARMNHPSTEQGNWRFRLERLPRRGVMRRLKHWIKLYRR
ncbi:MAG TPA: 4-alpha-glucanotransferase [Candidatus Gallimonas intestinigallinarum]|uniref:4-alpha-glucanotransferase n=1 Tax=Candidatus Gallimonas intestinigallinarum TaxID=2838604 RepID=A0A9D2DWI8_9FIRM|nr:4-alpha-glucanotransferase [Candidatus Gallimonas intestinigallinarum]